MRNTHMDVANAILKLIAVDALSMLSEGMVAAHVAYKDFESPLAQLGDIINVPLPSGPNGSGRLGNAQITLSRQPEATFTIPDVTKVLAIPELLPLYMRPALDTLNEFIETDLLNLSSQFVANGRIGIGGMTEGLIDTAESILFHQKLPAGWMQYMIVDSTQYAELRQIARFTDYRSAEEAGLNFPVEGPIGRIKSFVVLRSPHLARTSARSMALAHGAVGLISRRLPYPLPGCGWIAEYGESRNFGLRVSMRYNPSTLAQTFTVDCLYGVGVMCNAHGIQIES